MMDRLGGRLKYEVARPGLFAAVRRSDKLRSHSTASYLSVSVDTRTVGAELAREGARKTTKSLTDSPLTPAQRARDASGATTSPPITTAWSSRYTSQWRSGMSIWHGVLRVPPTSVFGPVENRKLP